MNDTPTSPAQNSPAARTSILVAGDICLDVAGLPESPGHTKPDADNWRQTGEVRTYYLPGGAMLLSQFVRAAVEARGPGNQVEVSGALPLLPKALACGARKEGEVLDETTFTDMAERLTRDEIVHSLLSLGRYPAKAGGKDCKSIRVERTHGFSGPPDIDPSIAVRPPSSENCTNPFILIDDTGNRFRRTKEQWPDAILTPPGGATLIYKFHRPLPQSRGRENALWTTVARNFPRRRVIILHLDDLRAVGAPISRGLSWERTALDLAWHLDNDDNFAALRECPHLVVRIGVDGALYRAAGKKDNPPAYSLVYDPKAIEGTFEDGVPGRMVGYGSAFAAAFTVALDAACAGSGKEIETTDVLSAITSGLHAARRLGQTGFIKVKTALAYPAKEIFTAGADDWSFASHPVFVIPKALDPDRSYWRLLESIFEGKTPLRNHAIENVATARETFPPGGEEEKAAKTLAQVPVASFGKLRTYDRTEIEHYRALHSLLRDYLANPAPPRPLSIAVFGPPGAGKSFGVKEVATSLHGQRGCKEIEVHTFNLSLYQSPDDLAAAFHLVRNTSLRGKVPLVFFDEFDTPLASIPLGWLRCFLAPMQDGNFLDRGAPHPIGPAIFVFAGGTSGTAAEFAAHAEMSAGEFKAAKGPDFLSRLRATLDIPSLNLLTASEPLQRQDGANAVRIQPPGTFNPYGPIHCFPCEAAILLRRASILAFNLKEKAPSLIQPDHSIAIDPSLLRALLHIPGFEHGNRSFEALLDMSHLAGEKRFTASLLPPPFQITLHANAGHLAQLISVTMPFPPEDREAIARSIHASYCEQKRKDPGHDPQSLSLKTWEEMEALTREGTPAEQKEARDLLESNLGQADGIANKLRGVGLWFRKLPVKATASSIKIETRWLDRLARAEHDRWVAQKRRQGWIAGRDATPESRIDAEKVHNCPFPWDDLSPEFQALDTEPVAAIPRHLAAARYEIVRP